MKKFIFGLMLLVSMLGIVGCANPSNSDDSVPVDETEYTLINKTNAPLVIAYIPSPGTFEAQKTVADGESYTVKKRDVYIHTYTGEYPFIGLTGTFAHFYITSNSNLNLSQDLENTAAKLIPVQDLAEPLKITQEYYNNNLKD